MPSCFSLIIFYKTKRRAERLTFSKGKYLKPSPDKIEGKNEEKLRQMFPVKWAVAKSWHIGVAARNTFDCCVLSLTTKTGLGDSKYEKFSDKIPPKCCRKVKTGAIINYLHLSQQHSSFLAQKNSARTPLQFLLFLIELPD